MKAIDIIVIICFANYSAFSKAFIIDNEKESSEGRNFYEDVDIFKPNLDFTLNSIKADIEIDGDGEKIQKYVEIKDIITTSYDSRDDDEPEKLEKQAKDSEKIKSVSVDEASAKVIPVKEEDHDDGDSAKDDVINEDGNDNNKADKNNSREKLYSNKQENIAVNTGQDKENNVNSGENYFVDRDSGFTNKNEYKKSEHIKFYNYEETKQPKHKKKQNEGEKENTNFIQKGYTDDRNNNFYYGDGDGELDKFSQKGLSDFYEPYKSDYASGQGIYFGSDDSMYENDFNKGVENIDYYLPKSKSDMDYDRNRMFGSFGMDGGKKYGYGDYSYY